MTGGTSERDRRTNYYDVLQVSPTASQEVIQAAYRALARGHHPDVNPNAAAAAKMQLLNAAHAVLADPERRAQYDLQRARINRPRPRAVVSTTDGPTAVRGRPRPHSPMRIEDERAARMTWTPTRSRLAAVVTMIIVLVVAVCVALWLTAAVLDDFSATDIAEDGMARLPAVLHVGPALDVPGQIEVLASAQPILNHA